MSPATGLLLLVATLAAGTGCGGRGEPATESLIRLGIDAAAEPVTAAGDTRRAEIVTVPHARRLCRPAGSRPGADTLRVALAARDPADATVRASLAGSREVARDVPVRATWSSIDVALGPGAADCAELTITGDDGARVAIAEPTVWRGGARRPWVVLYVFDTLRFDQLVGPDGALRGIPAFAAFAGDALLFERAFSNSSWTRPSVASLLTGVGATAHGVYDFSDRVRADVPSLAAELADAGYRTVAVSTNPNVLPIWGFDTGFDRFVDLKGQSGFEHLYQSLEAVTREIVTANADAPLFLFVHDNGPHAPYRTARGYAPPLPPPPRPTPRTKRTRGSWDRYDAAVQFSSRRFATLVARLHEVERYDDAVIALVGDHGESFGEDGRRGHGTTLSGVQIHVPLLLKAPRDRRLLGRITTPVVIAAVAPTILALLDLPSPAAWAEQLLPLEPSVARAASEHDIVSELDTPWGTAATLIRWPWKYLRHEEGEVLYHLERDPGESEDVADRHPDVVTRLRATLATQRQPAPDEIVFECVAGLQDTTIEATLFVGAHDPPVAFESNNMEGSDRVDRRGAALQVTFELPSESQHRSAGAFGADRDGIRLTGMTRERIRVRLGTQSRAPELLGPTGEALSTEGDTIHLADVTTGVHLERIDPGWFPRCRLYRTRGPATGPVEPIPEDVERRLRALGYL